jgi:phosphomannomutase
MKPWPNKKNPPPKLLPSPLAKVDARDGVKFVAEDFTWLMLRGSGTEPVLCIYAEAKSDADVQKLLKLVRSLCAVELSRFFVK